MKQHTEEKQPWVSCFLTNILVSYIEETAGRKNFIDYAGLFRAVEGFALPADPRSYLKDVNNWVPLAILRELHAQSERISGKKDIAYHAARAYFDPSKKQLPSLNEIIAHVLHDVRSLLICADLWASVQTNYLKFQSFESPGGDLYMLAQFEENSGPSVGAMHSLRGICEGFIRLCPFIEDVKCTEELTQLQIQDATREFPGFEAIQDGERLVVRRSDTKELVVEADRIPLRSEDILLSKDFMGNMPDAVVVPPQNDRIDVLTSLEETDPHRRLHAPTGYKILRSGTVSDGPLCYSLNKGQVYNAPYCRLRFALTERIAQAGDASTEQVSRKEVSRLLFDHLRQIKHAHMHTVQSNIEKRRLTLENIRLRQEIARRQLKVFLCHGSEDKQAARAIYNQLRQADMIPWLDEVDILPGQEWEAAIREAVRACHIILVLLSNTSVSKTGYIQKEIRFALERADELPEGKTYIIPVKLEECAVPRSLSKWQWLNLFEAGGRERLFSHLQRLALERFTGL